MMSQSKTQCDGNGRGENRAKVKGDVVIMMKHDLQKMVLEEDRRTEKKKMGGNELKQQAWKNTIKWLW